MKRIHGMKRKRPEPKKPTHIIKHGRVWFRYQIGNSLIVIETDPDSLNHWPEMPDYYRVCFGIDLPKGKPQKHGDVVFRSNTIPFIAVGDHQPVSPEEIEKAVLKAIKVKIAEQRKTGRSAKLAPKTIKKSQNKLALPLLPFDETV